MIYLGIAVAIFLAELFIKAYVEKHGEHGRVKKTLGGRVLLQKYHNKGAFLNIGERRSRVVAGLSVMLTIGTFFLLLLTLGKKGNTMLKTGLSFLLGGAFSNTYDRVARKYVVDYISFDVKCKPLAQIVFNTADFFIMAGAMITALAAK